MRTRGSRVNDRAVVYKLNMVRMLEFINLFITDELSNVRT